MARLVSAIILLLSLSSCALFRLAGVGAGAVEMAGARAALGGAATGMVARGAAATLAVEPGLALAGEGTMTRALAGVSRGGQVLLVDNAGMIRAGSQGLAVLDGNALTVGSRVVGQLRYGLLVEADTGAVVGRLRAALPEPGTQLRLTSGRIVTTTRPIMVDVLAREEGAYLIKLASGEMGWALEGVSALALTASAAVVGCDPQMGPGLFIRTSGEAIPFDQCHDDGTAFVLNGPNGDVSVSPSQHAEIVYGTFARARFNFES